MNSCANGTEKICAALHDVVGDTELTSKDVENG